MIQVAFVIPDHRSMTVEEDRARDFLSKVHDIRARTITFARIAAKPSALDSADVVWWHCDGEYPETSRITLPVVEAFKIHVARGRGLLLSLLACQLVTDLGLEDVRPNTIVRGRWAEGSWVKSYPDTRGFAGFNHHPIFKGFLGGLYTWAPEVGDSYSACYYQDALPGSGKVIAVEKLYIKLDERRRNIIEYAHGRGRIVTIGSHFYFSDKAQRFRPHLEKFASNCLNYFCDHKKLLAHRALRRPANWSFETPSVSSFEHSSKSLVRANSSLPSASSGLEIHREIAAEGDEGQFFAMSGRRVVVMGRERAGIDEIWSHPTRIFKNVTTNIKVGISEWQPLSDLRPTVTIRPESLTRRYECDGAVIEEVIYTALKLPVCIVHYRVESREHVEILVSAHSDLRLMWPLSEQATGSLRYSWDPGLRSVVVTDSFGNNAAIFGSSSPPSEQLVGQFSEIALTGGHIAGIPTEKIEVSSAIRVVLTTHAPRCSFVFAGSGISLQDGVRHFRSAVKTLPRLLAEQVQRFIRLQNKTLQIVTPDDAFNKSYRWSLVGTDKLFAETPCLGSSFLAGFGLSSSGWDGGQKVSGRPGYAWYFGRDSAWTCMAALDYGDCPKVRAALEFLGKHQDVDGKILHELTASGHAHFDAADSTPLYLIVFGKYLRTSGDNAFVRQEFQRIKKALDYCFSTDTDGDHLIENSRSGHGWIEGGPLFPSHTEYYLSSCWAQALAETAYIAEAMNERRLASKCAHESNVVRAILRKNFLNESTGFYSVAKNFDGTFRSEKTILPTVGMYFDCADGPSSQGSLSEYASDRFNADWGVRMVSSDDPLFDPTGYHYGSIWPLFTGWTSLAEFHFRRPMQGFSHLLSNALLYDQFSAGCIEEALRGDRFSPAGVCPHQAWSGTMVLQPALEGMLGLRTDANRRSIELRPYLPPNWKKMEVRNIRVGEQAVTMNVRRSGGETIFAFSVSSQRKAKHFQKIDLTLQPVFPLATHVQGVWIDETRKRFRGVAENYESSPAIHATLQRHLEVRFEHSGGVSVVPPRPHYVRGEESKGLRILEEEWNGDSYLLTLEGKAGEEYLVDVFDAAGAVRRVQGAVALARDQDILTLSVVFSKSSLPGYARTRVALSG